MRCKQGTLTDEDRKRLEELAVDREKADRAFFERHGVSESAQMEALDHWERMVEVERKAPGGSLMWSPLARKAYTLGYAMGRAE